MTTSLADGFSKGKGKKKTLFHTHNTPLPSLSRSLSLILTCQIPRALSLTGSPTHYCVFSQRQEKECELQAGIVWVFFSFAVINRQSGQKKRKKKVHQCMMSSLFLSCYTTWKENKKRKMLFAAVTGLIFSMCDAKLQKCIVDVFFNRICYITFFENSVLQIGNGAAIRERVSTHSS